MRNDGVGGAGNGGGGTGAAGGVGAGRNAFVDTLNLGQVNKVDLLFMVDNSIAMADKQSLLAASIPALVKRLTSPSCVDTSGSAVAGSPADPAAACPAGSTREFAPIADIHVGVVTSSLGGHGDTLTCPSNDADPVGEQMDDHAHLIATRPRFASENAKPMYTGTPFQPPDPNGFLDWNPGGSGGALDVGQFVTTFQMMVTASSEFGCGLESQLEAVYRFLSDPNPPQSIERIQCPNAPANTFCATPSGVDTALLAERAAFLRPDSAVVVALVTDESDCSIRDSKQYYYAAREDIVLPNGTSACTTNPNDACCFSCASHAPAGCPDPGTDPRCQAQPSPELDPINLRCFHEMQRFGLDFLYPIKRYVNAFKQPQLCTSQVALDFDPTNPATCPDANGDGKPDVVQNPLYVNADGLPRSPSLVYVAGIVGVPWQDIQAVSDRNGNAYPSNELHYQTASSLLSNMTWDRILGDPTASPPILPTDGLMVESSVPRSGVDINGKPIPGPTAAPADDNGINGHDWANGGEDDLMYACIFPLPASRDCAVVEQQRPEPGCDCGSQQAPGDNNPLCRDPAMGINNYGTVQYAAKAYPSMRELQVLKDVGENGIVASICARNTTVATAPDYAYQPAMTAIVDRLSEALRGKCLPRTLVTDSSGKTTCKIFEATAGRTQCDPSRGRSDAPASDVDALRARLTQAGICGGTSGIACDSLSLCELAQLGASCHQAGTQDGVGFCYIDPTQNPSDDPSLVAQCPPNQARLLRFVDPQNETPAPGATVLIYCGGSEIGL